MDIKQMKILIVEDDVNACNDFINCIKSREDINLIGITDSDIEALKYVKLHHPEGIILDIELNNSVSGNTDSLDFLTELKKLNLNYNPIIIVTTHINSQSTYNLLHRNGIIMEDYTKARELCMQYQYYDFSENFDSIFKDFPILYELLEEKLMIQEKQRIVLTEKGISYSDVIGPLFISKTVKEKMKQWIDMK